MSRATELAAAEAARVEAEEPDTPDTEPETPSEPTPDEQEEAEQEEQTPESAPSSQHLSEKDLREMNRRLQAEDQRHEKRLHEIYGSTWGDRAMCPLCLQEGFVIPAEPGTFDPQQRAAVEAAMGTVEPPEYREHPTEGRCEVCDGWGEMINGSRREGMELSACPTCMGTGHAAKPIAPPINVTPITPYPAPNTTANPVYPGVNVDNWGRPPGHPDWGRDPSQVNAYGS